MIALPEMGAGSDHISEGRSGVKPRMPFSHLAQTASKGRRAFRGFGGSLPESNASPALTSFPIKKKNPSRSAPYSSSRLQIFRERTHVISSGCPVAGQYSRQLGEAGHLELKNFLGSIPEIQQQETNARTFR